VVVIDPGHRHFPRRINRQVPAGGFTKPCNTTGTATDGGYPEATFVWQVSRLVAARLRGLGATVRLTRHSNRTAGARASTRAGWSPGCGASWADTMQAVRLLQRSAERVRRWARVELPARCLWMKQASVA
jgi:hypothetical protein